jgi:hypothetical protein
MMAWWRIAYRHPPYEFLFVLQYKTNIFTDKGTLLGTKCADYNEFLQIDRPSARIILLLFFIIPFIAGSIPAASTNFIKQNQ